MRGLYQCMAAAALWTLLGVASAAHLQISPVTLALRPGENATVINLSNEGDETLYGQVRVYDWDQRDGEDVLTPSRAMLASPPLLELAPGARQVIRLIRAGAGNVASEQAYRVLIDEIPPPGQPPREGVTVRLRYSVPLFVSPAAPGAPTLAWRLSRGPSGWMLEGVNSGARHAQISAVRLIIGNQVHEINRGLLGYVLTGRTRRWNVTLDPAPSIMAAPRIQARVNANPVEAAVTAVGVP